MGPTLLEMTHVEFDYFYSIKQKQMLSSCLSFFFFFLSNIRLISQSNHLVLHPQKMPITLQQSVLSLVSAH